MYQATETVPTEHEMGNLCSSRENQKAVTQTSDYSIRYITISIVIIREFTFWLLRQWQARIRDTEFPTTMTTKPQPIITHRPLPPGTHYPIILNHIKDVNAYTVSIFARSLLSSSCGQAAELSSCACGNTGTCMSTSSHGSSCEGGGAGACQVSK